MTSSHSNFTTANSVTGGAEPSPAALSRIPRRGASLKELTLEFHRRGYDRPNTPRIVAELSVFVLLAFGGMLVFLEGQSPAYLVLGLALSTLGAFGISTNTHTASHYAASRDRRVNRALTYFGFPFMLGISATRWWRTHCVLHHSHPNVAGMDPDIDFMPFFATTTRDVDGARGLLRVYFSYQWLLLPFAVSLNGLNMQRQGWSFVLRKLIRDRRDAAALLDFACLCAHSGLWLGLPAFLWSPGLALLFYGLRLALLGYAAFLVFAPAHLPVDAQCVQQVEQTADFVLRQTCTTTNFRVGAIGRILCSGLDSQIEHHLFPAFDHTRYSKMSADVRAFCDQHGYPYRHLGWWDAVVKAFGTFRRPKPISASLGAPAAARDITEDSCCADMQA
ncbi:MAG TPA: acyl-CoA desaturase [Polyangiaceae bacterium]|nr:acyl-CoA desaturase [Polyangiaceae bacterium]